MKQVGNVGRILLILVAVLLIASFTVAMAHAEDDKTSTDAAAYVSRGNAYYSLGQYEEARA